MALSRYTGLTPRTLDQQRRITRAVTHHHWTPTEETRAQCDHCGADLNLHERHVLVTTESGDGTKRHYLCNERCVADWVDGAE